MADEGTKPSDLVEPVSEKAAELVEEAEEGRSARTPVIAITGVSIFFGVLVGVILTVALVLYFVLGGR